MLIFRYKMIVCSVWSVPSSCATTGGILWDVGKFCQTLSNDQLLFVALMWIKFRPVLSIIRVFIGEAIFVWSVLTCISSLLPILKNKQCSWERFSFQMACIYLLIKRELDRHDIRSHCTWSLIPPTPLKCLSRISCDMETPNHFT